MNIFSARLSIQGLWNWLPSFLGANTTSEVPNWIFGVEYPEGSSRVDSRLKGIIGAVLTALLMHEINSSFCRPERQHRGSG